MAMTASIVIGPASAYINQPVGCALTISNSGSSTVTMNSVQPLVYLTGTTPPYRPACAVSEVLFSPGFPSTVAPSGSLVVNFNVVFFSGSQGLINAGSGTYSIGAICQSNDGSSFAPTPDTLNILNLPFPASQQ